VLRNPAHHVTSECDAVSILLTDERAHERVTKELRAFAAAGLPRGTTLEILTDEQERSLRQPHACTGQTVVPLATDDLSLTHL
jgi:hypothetical protein